MYVRGEGQCAVPQDEVFCLKYIATRSDLNFWEQKKKMFENTNFISSSEKSLLNI